MSGVNKVTFGSGNVANYAGKYGLLINLAMGIIMD